MKNNPSRRNRNIGTSKSGHGQNNSMRIPESWHDERVFWSKVNNPVFLTSRIDETELTIIVEPVTAGYRHYVTPSDIERILSSIGGKYLEGLAAVVLKQPKQKENLLNPVWGRFVWHADIGKASGSMIMIDAQKVDQVLRWNKSLSPEGMKELERLKKDGHEFTSDKRYHHIKCSSSAIRSTQLYRTLLHELGHFEDYRINITEKDSGDIDHWFDLVDQYEQRTTDQKEQFAHQFAEKKMESIRNSGSAPFGTEIDFERMKLSDLSSSWFAGADA